MNADIPNFPPALQKAVVHLYVSGRVSNIDGAYQRLSRELESRLGANAFELQVYDVWEDPELAVQNRILATPTLIRISPRPQARVVGQVMVSNAIDRLFGAQV